MKLFTRLIILLTVVVNSFAFAEGLSKSITPEFLAELKQVSEEIYQVRSGPTWLAKYSSSQTDDLIIHLKANLRILQTMFPSAEDAIGQIVVSEMLAVPYDYNRGTDQKQYLNRLYELLDHFLRPAETAVPKWRLTPFGKTFLKQSSSLFEINMNVSRSDSNSEAGRFRHWGAETKALARFAPKDVLNGKLPEFLSQAGEHAFEHAYFGDDLSGNIKMVLDAFRKVEKALDDGTDCGALLSELPGTQLAIENDSASGRKKRKSK